MEKILRIGIEAVFLAVVVGVIWFFGVRESDYTSSRIRKLEIKDSLQSAEEKKIIDSISFQVQTLLKRDTLKAREIMELRKNNEELEKKYNSIRVKLPRF